ncbi:MAG TPA: ferredoxin [Acidimicrobiia bacterium]|jgi:ferredoxin|nr:ferredoxin [Acidimicrobiia bacterium]
MRLRVDPQKCFGHALCLEETSDLFGWDEENQKAFAKEGEVPPEREAKAREAVRCCPEQAIVLTD